MKTYYLIDEELLRKRVGNFSDEEWFELIISDAILDTFKDELEKLIAVDSHIVRSSNPDLSSEKARELVFEGARDFFIKETMESLFNEHDNSQFKIGDFSFQKLELDIENDLSREEIMLIAKIQ